MRTIITLSNGKKVGNFSSPHPFTFEDGSVLPAVTEEESKRLAVTFIEDDLSIANGGNKGDIQLLFDISNEIRQEMREWIIMKQNGLVDIVYCPLPMIRALVGRNSLAWAIRTPFRAIRMTDRIKKLVSIEKQCL